jgi:hypothetical protein
MQSCMLILDAYRVLGRGTISPILTLLFSVTEVLKSHSVYGVCVIR